MPVSPKKYEEPSVFTPENLLREARRQKSIPEGAVPEVCILDPDGDIVQNLVATGRAQPDPYWACYHTKMYNLLIKGSNLAFSGMRLVHLSPSLWQKKCLPLGANC
mgnify:CR=1 FL=1